MRPTASIPRGGERGSRTCCVPQRSTAAAYQLRLADARALIGASCAGWPPPSEPLPAAPAPPVPLPPPVMVAAAVPDTVAPLLRLGGSVRQPAVDRGAVVVTAGCPTDRCRISATGSLTIPGRARPVALRSKPRDVARGQRAVLRLPLSPSVRRAARRALRHRRTLRATIRVVAGDEAQNRTIRLRTVRITR